MYQKDYRFIKGKLMNNCYQIKYEQDNSNRLKKELILKKSLEGSLNSNSILNIKDETTTRFYNLYLKGSFLGINGKGLGTSSRQANEYKTKLK